MNSKIPADIVAATVAGPGALSRRVSFAGRRHCQARIHPRLLRPSSCKTSCSLSCRTAALRRLALISEYGISQLCEIRTRRFSPFRSALGGSPFLNDPSQLALSSTGTS